MQQPPNQEYPQQQNTSWGPTPQWQHYEQLSPQYPQPMVPQQQQWQQQPFSPQQNTPLPNGLQQPPVRPSQTLSRITWILVGVAIGLVFGLILGSSYGKSATTSTNTTTAQDTAQPTSQPTQITTPTHTPKWTTVQTFNGSGNKKTAIFNTSNDWKIIWSCNPASDFSGEYNLSVDVNNSDGTTFDYAAVNEICKTGNTTNSTEEHQGGQVYLDIQSDGGTGQSRCKS